MRRFISSSLRPLFGLLLSIAAAFGSVYLFRGSTISEFVPLLFLGVLFVLSLRFGIAVGVFGSLGCALIFAHFLFSPVGSWHVTEAVARRNLSWMILGGVAF